MNDVAPIAHQFLGGSDAMRFAACSLACKVSVFAEEYLDESLKARRNGQSGSSKPTTLSSPAMQAPDAEVAVDIREEVVSYMKEWKEKRGIESESEEEA